MYFAISSTSAILLCCLYSSASGISPPSSGLYFKLNGDIYLPGQIVPIDYIGWQPDNRSDAGFTLVCATENVNPLCCRRSDGGNLGNWYYPDGTVVGRPGQTYHGFIRIGYRHQIRLAQSYYFSDSEPRGSYICEIPNSEGVLVNASIRIDIPTPTLTSSPSIVPSGGSVTFTCSIQVLKEQNFTFTFTSPDNKLITSASTGVVVDDSVPSVRKYTITSVKPAQAGEYICAVFGGQRSSTTLNVKLQPPQSVILLAPNEPIYATSSQRMAYYVQFYQTSLDVSLHYNIQCFPPSGSSQTIPRQTYRAAESILAQGFVSLNFLMLSDSGTYVCSVYLSSSNQKIITSNSTNGSAVINVVEPPTIEVEVTSNDKPSYEASYHIICSHRTTDTNFVYSAEFEWYHNSILLVGMKNRLLLFSSLSLSDVGNYTCKVTAMSDLLGIPVNGTSSHTISLQAPPPTSVDLSIFPTIIYVGSSPQLTCTAGFSLTAEVRLTVTIELNGPGRMTQKTATRNSNNEYVSMFLLSNVNDQHSGLYNCTVVVTGYALTPSLSIMSRSIILSVVGVPSSPIINQTVEWPTSIHLTWTVSQNEIIDFFWLNYTYSIRGCYGLFGRDSIMVSNNYRHFRLWGLQENSDFFFALTAVNTAGPSSSFIREATTPTAAPTQGPENVRATSVSSTKVNIAWDPVPCSHQNTNITGYRVQYFTLSGFSQEDLDISQLEYKVSNLIPRTKYTFRVYPIHDLGVIQNISTYTTIDVNTSLSEELGFFINGTALFNNSVIDVNSIGSYDYGLFCVTNLLACCRPPFSSQAKGIWYFPNKSAIPSFSSRSPIFQTRHSSSVILHRNRYISSILDEGIFMCSIPNSMETVQNLYIHIARDFTDLVIEGLIYSRISKLLTCTSSGRPVNSIQWLKDGRIIGNNSSVYSQAQELSDGTSATYQHTLSSEAKTNFQGRFTCIVEDLYGNADRKTVMINNCPPGEYGVVAFDGSTVCVQCPANSMSVSEGSNECGCLQGYYRNDLEDAHFPCSRPPSRCRNLKVKVRENSSITGTVALQWNRPIITGRKDIYYNIYLSSDAEGKLFAKHNTFPLENDLATVEYTLSGLRPFTRYNVKVSANNGVSGNDSADDVNRICIVSWTT